MSTNFESALHNCSTTDGTAFMMAFEKAIQNPELRKQIICALESAGLLPSSVRRPA